MIVIKLGGSLSGSDQLLNCLDRIEKNYQGRSVVLVPGGGAFANQVRIAQQYWCFDDLTAHHMAILAMQQMALMFKGLKAEFTIATNSAEIHGLSNSGKTVIWLPDIKELDNAGVAASWDITSDSLSAWLAHTVSASELILIKSAFIDPGFSMQQLAELNVVDKAFCGFVAEAAFRIRIVNAQDFE